MNTTTNYGLKLYEGSDLFNPLTVENVNAGDIDDAMKAISDHSVGTATELTTGTVHALTRADTDRNVFLFVATSNFTAGDTFVLDGVQVSALTPDGQPLATGSYVIGSSVLCALHDTLITVYVNPAKAKDADMLDGHDSSYYATDEDLDTVAGTIQAVSDKVGTAVLTTTAPDCSGAINELNTQLTLTSDDIKTGLVLRRYGKLRELRVANVLGDTNGVLTTLSASDRPTGTAYLPQLIMVSGTANFSAYAVIDPTTGNVQGRYFGSGSTDASIGNNHPVYGCLKWLVD